MRPLLLALLLSNPLSTLAEDTHTLRLLTYNIHGGIGTDRVFDLKRIAAVIEGTDPDVVALQEVDRKTRRSRVIDIASELADLTGMDFVFGASISFQGGQYGNAILSRIPIESSRTLPLPEKIPVEKRSLLSARLLVHGQAIRILATHLCHRKEENRIAAASVLADVVEDLEGPSFLMGDLNALPDSKPLGMLYEAGWRKPSPTSRFTVPVKEPKRQIDYVLYCPPSTTEMRVREVSVLEEAVASDHRPLLVVFEWRSERSRDSGRGTPAETETQE